MAGIEKIAETHFKHFILKKDSKHIQGRRQPVIVVR